MVSASIHSHVAVTLSNQQTNNNKLVSAIIRSDDSRAPLLLTRRRKCGRLRRLCRASWQEARVAVAVRAFVSPLSEHVSPEQLGGAPLADGPALNCNQWLVPGDGPALNCNQYMFMLQLRSSGGTSNLGVDAGLCGRLSFSLHVNGFEGWCSPRCFGPRTASGRCCGDGDSSLVRGSRLRGAYRPSNAHEYGCPVALKTDLAYRNGPAS